MSGQNPQLIRHDGHRDAVPLSRGRMPIPPPPHHRWRAAVGLWLQRCLGLLLFACPLAAATRTAFSVTGGDAVQTLRLFSQQSHEQILYPVEQVRGVRTHPVHGVFSAREALEIMLAATPLTAVQDVASGALVIRRRHSAPDTSPPSSRPGEVPAPVVRRDQPPAAGAGADEIVVLSPFEVRSRADRGYKAVNTVSATRMAVPLSQLPMSVSTFTEAFIVDQKAYDLYDIVKWAPGVHQDNISPQGWVRYNIRGFTSAAVQRNGFDSFRFIDTTNIARVEVVKGPASLLYGQINPGGVINYLTKRPEPQPRVQLTASAGDYGYRRGVLDATGPVPGTKDHLLYRFIAMGEHIQQFQDFVHGTKSMLAPSLTWRIASHTALTVDYEHFERREDMLTSGVVLLYAKGLPTIPYPGLPWDFSYAGEGDYQNFASDALTAEFTTQFGEHVDLRASFLDSAWDMEWRASGQGGTGLIPQSFIDAFYPPGTLTSPDAMFRRNRWEHQQGGERTGQVDLVTRFDLGGVRFHALLGAQRNFDTHGRNRQKNNPNVASSPFYLKPWDLRHPSTWDRRVPFGVDALIPAVDTANASTGSSLFAVLSAAAFDERLRLLGGFARHELHNAPTRNYLAGTATPPSDRAANVPQAGALVELRPGVSFFASYSESFLANATLLRVDNVPTSPAAPSVGQGTEAGFKLQLWPDRLSGTVSAYRIRASPTGIVTVTSGLDPASGTTLFTDVQGGTQLSEGLEADLLFTPFAGCQLLAGFSRCHAVYEQHPTNRAFDGSPLVATPDRTFSLWGKYTLPAGPAAGLTLAGGANYVGRMTYVANNPLVRLGPYTTIDLSLGYRFRAFSQDWDADISVKNLTDEHYYASASSWGFPRHFIFSLRTAF